MIWGFTLEPGVPCAKTVDSEVHLTMAALDEPNSNEKTRCQVLVKVHSSDILLCTLVDGLILQQNLNLNLMPGEKAVFHAKGGKVHLSGYSKSHAKENSNLSKRDAEEDVKSQQNTDVISPIQVKQEILDDDEDSKVTETPSEDGKPPEASPVKVKQEILDDKEDSKVTDIATPSSYGKPAGGQNELLPAVSRSGSQQEELDQDTKVECIQEALVLTQSPSPEANDTYRPMPMEDETFAMVGQAQQNNFDGAMASCSPSPPRSGHFTSFLGQQDVRNDVMERYRQYSSVESESNMESNKDITKKDYRSVIPNYYQRSPRQANEYRQTSALVTIPLDLGPSQTVNYLPDRGQHQTLHLQADQHGRAYQSLHKHKRSHTSYESDSQFRGHENVQESVNIQSAEENLLSQKRKCIWAKEGNSGDTLAIHRSRQGGVPSVSSKEVSRPSRQQPLTQTLVPRVVLHAKEVIRNLPEEIDKPVRRMPPQRTPAASDELRCLPAPCASCGKQMIERYRLKLGEREHYFCKACHNTFSQDKQLQRYTRIIPYQARNQPKQPRS